MTHAAEAAIPEPIAAADRCDRCGAQAVVRAQLRAGGGLLFCDRHWADHADALAPSASGVFDARGL